VARSARNPWVAMDVATDPVAHARLLSRAHERGLLGARTPSAHVRELVLSSLEAQHCRGCCARPVGAPVRISGDELEEARERLPLAPPIGVIQSTLSSLDQDARHIVAIGDAAANLLWVQRRRLIIRFRSSPPSI
jgi:hypothetical protein